MAECAVGNLTVEVPALIASESEIPLALFHQHLYAPTYLVGLETLRDVHRHVGSDNDVPVLVVAILDEEYAYNLLAQESVDDEILTIVLWHLSGLCPLIA